MLSPLAWAPFRVTLWLVWAVSLAAATGSIVLVLRDRGATVTPSLLCKAFTWSCVSAIALEPARSALGYGQIEFILMFIVVADLLVAGSRCRGIGIGLTAAVKLTPLAFIIVLAVSRDVKSVIRPAASFLVPTGLSWLLWPQLSRTYWFHDVSDPGRAGTVTYGGNQCWYAILHRPPFPASGSEFAWLLLSLMTRARHGRDRPSGSAGQPYLLEPSLDLGAAHPCLDGWPSQLSHTTGRADNALGAHRANDCLALLVVQLRDSS